MNSKVVIIVALSLLCYALCTRAHGVMAEGNDGTVVVDDISASHQMTAAHYKLEGLPTDCSKCTCVPEKGDFIVCGY